MKRFLLVVVWLVLSSPLHAENFDSYAPGRLAISGNGKRLAVASEDQHVRVWDLASRKLVFDIPTEQPASSVALDESGEEMLVGISGTRASANEFNRSPIMLWDLRMDEPKLLWKKQVIGSGQGLAFAPGGKWVAAICIYSRLCFFDRRDGSLRRVLTEDGNGYWEMAITPDEKVLVTAGQSVKIWNIEDVVNPKIALDEDYWITSEESERHLKMKPWGGGCSVAVSSDSHHAYVLGFFKSKRGRNEDCAEFDLRSEKEPRIVAAAIETEEGQPTCVTLSHDDQTLAFGTTDGRIEFRNLQGEIIGEMRLPTPVGIRSLKFFDASRKMAVATVDGAEVHILDLEKKQHEQRLLPQ